MGYTKIEFQCDCAEPILRVKVLMMVDSLVLTFLTRLFLERFMITIEQPYPSSKVEKKIILGSMDKYGKKDEKFVLRI